MVSSSHLRDYVVDANVIFSSLISGREEYLSFFANNRIFLPDFALAEIQQYQQLIWQKTKLKPERFREFVLLLFREVTVVPNLLISTQHHLQAFLLCRDIDPKDSEYIAFALGMDMPLLTRDKPLVNGLRARGFTDIVLMDELFESPSL